MYKMSKRFYSLAKLMFIHDVIQKWHTLNYELIQSEITILPYNENHYSAFTSYKTFEIRVEMFKMNIQYEYVYFYPNNRHKISIYLSLINFYSRV